MKENHEKERGDETKKSTGEELRLQLGYAQVPPMMATEGWIYTYVFISSRITRLATLFNLDYCTS